MTTVTSGVRGLDLVAGGGMRLVSRGERLAPMTSILIRGPAGAGKSVLAAQLARSLGAASSGNVLYGCVEVLPSEIAAQQAGLYGERGAVHVLSERNGPRELRGEGQLIAAVLDADTGLAALDRSLRHARALSVVAKLDIKVVVIDSLARGYRLTNRARREEADAMLKNAAQGGYTLILVEEAAEGSAPSVWSYVVDTVIELHPPSPDDVIAVERRLSVTKHRYLASVPGKHRFTIVPDDGVLVFPPLQAYGERWARRVAPSSVEPEWALTFRDDDASRAPAPGGLIAVYGARGNVWPVALAMTRTPTPRAPTLFVLFGASFENDGNPFDLTRLGNDVFLSLGPTTSAERAMSMMAQLADERRVARVVVGDLLALREFPLAAGLVRSFHALARYLQGTPVVLVETAKAQDARGPTLADAIVEVTASNAPSYTGTVWSRVSQGEARWTLSPT